MTAVTVCSDFGAQENKILGLLVLTVKNIMGNLIEIMLNLLIALSSMAILTILILPIQEHGISFHFFESFSS